ncbi:DUF6173 family protein [Caulobacter sp. 17J80-11]|uniref:DUF6173 family protein n=1 Tax=Caulobacter sp. 17J80-11 TaxID=2763502 RepID=UPI001653CD9B|nr:DUF6173 family protein [Caulobacter sp. 17J80-11]MBC6981080.1 hypothetical protein [Caulobacter sp. 17J80-11]
MDDHDLRKLALRLSVEASPEAPTGEGLGPCEPSTPPATPADAKAASTPDEEAQALVPISAWTSPEDAKVMAAGMKAKANPAEWTFERLCRMIEDFENKLSADEEIGATIVGAPGEGAFRVDDIGFWGPDLIMFYGKNQHGRAVRLIQHYQQLSVLLSALPREEEARPARRIGFALRSRMEEAAADNAPAPPPGGQAQAGPGKAPVGRGERP